MGTKNVVFEYYRVFVKLFNEKTGKLQENKSLFNLKPVLEKASKVDANKRVFLVNGEEAALQHIECDKFDKELWKMRFIRTRQAVIPIIVNNKNYECNRMNLEDDEYIGEEIAVIYYSKYNILMIQRNRNSLSPAGIERYFTTVLNNASQIELSPISKPEDMRKLKNKKNVKKLSFNFATSNIYDETYSNKSYFKEILKGVKKTGALNVSITLSVGYNKKERLKEEFVSEISELSEEKIFSKLEANVKEDTNVEIVDLIDYKLFDVKQMEYSRISPIDYDNVIVIMGDLFNKRKELFKKMFEEVED